MSQVVIGDILPRTQATAIASQTVFMTNWTANYSTDVDVYYTPNGQAPDDFTQKLATSAYTVAFIGALQQVQVTLINPANAGDIITIVRNTPAARSNLYSNTNFTPSMLNNDFGILTLVDQQNQLVNQLIAPRYNYSATIVDGVDNILPILGPNQIWVMNSNSTAIEAINFNTAATGTVTQIDTGTGLTGGPITSFGTISLAPIGDQEILANISGNPAAPVGVPISSVLTGYLPLTGGTMSGDIDMGTNSITNMANPTNAQDAATKAYVDTFLSLSGGTMTGTLNMGSQILTGIPNPINPTDAVNYQTFQLGLQGLNPVESVQASSTTNLTATYNNGASGVGATLTNSGAQAALVLDGYSVQVGDRLLIQFQSSTFQNGIYVATNIGSVSTDWVLTRATDYDTPANMTKGNLVGVVNGTLYKASSIAQSSTVTVVGTDPVTFTIIFSPQTYAGSTSITTLGTITTGVWNGSNIPLANGGTNASLTAANGAIPYSTSSAIALLSPAGSAGLAFLSGGAGAPTWSTLPPITKVNSYVIGTTGAFSYTPSTGTQQAFFELQAGGGGSGGTTGAASQSAASGGGAGGNYLQLLVTGATNLANITGSVGVGGSAGTAGNNTGGAGGNTTLTINGGTQWVASGGGGGNGQTSSGSPQSSGTPGIISASVGGTNATLIKNIAGTSASAGYSNGAVTTYGWLSSGGGNSFLSTITRYGTQIVGTAGSLYGGGASGSINGSGSNQTGSAGAQGCVVVTEFISV